METSWQESFWQNFAESLKVVIQNRTSSGNKDIFYYYTFGGEWTILIDETIPKVAKLEGYNDGEIKPEYYYSKENRVDLVLGKENEDGFNIEFAIEHENDHKTSDHELKQLLSMRKNVKKVLISYYHWEHQSIETIKFDFLDRTKNTSSFTTKNFVN